MQTLYPQLLPDGSRVWFASAVPTQAGDLPGGFTANDLLVIVGSAQAGQTYVCTVSGTPGTWVPVAQAKASQLGTAAATQFFVGGQQIEFSTQGVDTAGVATSMFVGSVFISNTVTLTGIQALLGSVGGTDHIVAVLYDSTGKVVANSALDSSVTAGTTATVQQVPFTATYKAVPGLYFIGVMLSGTTAKIRTIFNGGNATTIQTGQTFNTLTNITPPTTFTTAQAPVASTY